MCIRDSQSRIICGDGKQITGCLGTDRPALLWGKENVQTLAVLTASELCACTEPTEPCTVRGDVHAV